MAKLNDKVQNALQEGRILVLGAQVIIGFEFRSVFEKGFEKLPRETQYVKLTSLCVMLVGLALLLLPAAYHRIVERGETTRELHRFVSRVMFVALLPFALGLAFDLYVATEKVSNRTGGIVAGVLTLGVALFFWYGFEFWRRQRREPRVSELKEQSHAEDREREGQEMSQGDDNGSGGEKTTNKIKHALLEARMVLPGAQALLGFQFATMLVEGFDKLPDSSKAVHLVSLALVALAVIYLIAPAAYHRIVEEGEESEHFHNVASRFMLAAMVPLALGICGDLFVVVRKVTESATVGVVFASLMLAAFYGLWFGYTFAVKGRKRQAAR